MAEAPAITDHLCADCAAHFEQVKELLQELSIPYRLNPRLVRGLDYYTRTAFEFISGRGGAQSSLGGGGRYDYLVEQCGGPPTPGVGVAFGVERMLLAAGQETELRPETAPVFVAAAGTGLTVETYRLAAELRQRGIAAEVELLERSLKAQLKYAGRKNIEKVVIIGERELEQGLVALRDMAAGSQESIPRESLWEKLGWKSAPPGIRSGNRCPLPKCPLPDADAAPCAAPTQLHRLLRLGSPPPRSRRADLYRFARPERACAAGL